MAAFVASRVSSREVAKRMFQQIEDAGLAERGVLLNEYDSRTMSAESYLLA